MTHPSLDAFLASDKIPTKGPVAVILVEDLVEVESTITHHMTLGFKRPIVLAPQQLKLNAKLAASVECVTYNLRAAGAFEHAINAIQAALPPETWLYYCFNAEYLFFPFCEYRTAGEMLAFHAEERREAMLTYVVDLYADDLSAFPDAVSLEAAHLDRSGYYALARTDPANHNHPKDRQLNFYGGLRWRFEEHVAKARRKIDRISIFRTRPGLEFRADHTLSNEELNTYACPWHHNLTAAVCSFRTAKALKTNPGSKFEIESFKWHNSTPFQWHSQQLLDLGLMEPGQWF